MTILSAGCLLSCEAESSSSVSDEYKQDTGQEFAETKQNAAAEKHPVDWVDPLIDSASPRWIFFSSASRPFGMVNLSPDTDVEGDWGAGYLYDTDKIRWFSHLHAWQLSAVPVMPTTGAFKGTSGSDVYRSRFSHDKEIVGPGYHAVTLDDYDIRVELTSTDRVGFHRYRFPESSQCHILFDLGARLGPPLMDDALIRRVGDVELQGYVVNAPTRRRPKACTIYFVARFNKPFELFGGWVGNKDFVGVDEVSGKNSGAFVRYSTGKDEVILLKVALSYVSIEQARLNLQTELDHWDFNRVRSESEKVWNNWLSRIGVEGGTEAQRTKFYTDLWHTLLGRRTNSDVNGKYTDNTGPKPVVRQIPLGPNGKPKYAHFNSDAFWTTFWNINQLWGLAYPEVMNQFANCLVDMYKNGGLIPRGPTGGNYSFVMIGAHSTPFIVSAYMKGIRSFDVEKAYEGMRKNAFPGGLMSKAGYEHNGYQGGGIEYYIERGYIPEGRQITGAGKKGGPIHIDGAAQTLEYAYDDWCLAQMAKALGKEGDYRLFMKRAQNYRNIFDNSTGFMRPRNLDGSWLTPFDPLEPLGFCEGTAWQYNWFVPHDMQGLINLMGRRSAFNHRLNHAFEMAMPENFVSRYVNYGNQPSTAMAHLFNYSGAPWLTQKWVRQVKELTFGGVTPQTGYRGDEDQGQAGGLGVLMAIGLFEVRGGAAQQPIYEITSPIFDKITIHLDTRYYPGEKFVILTRNNSKENKYIQSAILDGKTWNKPWLYHQQLVDGGTLEIELGPEPNKQWGSNPKDAPPSMTPVK